jgi:hypothetical protein
MKKRTMVDLDTRSLFEATLAPFHNSLRDLAERPPFRTLA